MILTFGKYNGLDIKEVIKKDYRYIQWLVKCACSYQLKAKEASEIRKNADELLNQAINQSKYQKEDKILFSVYNDSEWN